MFESNLFYQFFFLLKWRSKRIKRIYQMLIINKSIAFNLITIYLIKKYCLLKN
jgi:hypothetical protein